MESPRRRRIEGTARVLFLGTLSEEEWEVHHRDHEWTEWPSWKGSGQ